MMLRQKPGAKAEQRPLKFGFILARNFTLSAYAMFVDTLRLVSDELDRSGRKYVDWDVLSENSQLVMSSCGTFVAPTVRLSDRLAYDYLVIVGGRLNVEQPISAEMGRFLRSRAVAGTSIVGLCTASFILAELGLLRGKVACVSWLHRKEFQERHPAIALSSQNLFVESGSVATCAGGAAAADLAALIVNRHLSPDLSKKAFEILQIERQRRGTDAQPRVPLDVTAPKDWRIRKALVIMEQLLPEKCDIDGLSERLNMSRRHVERLFKLEFGFGPSEAFHRVRLKSAKILIENSTKSITEISADLGYENQYHFSRRYRALYGVSPTEARNRATASH